MRRHAVAALEPERYQNPIAAADIGKPDDRAAEGRQAYVTEQARSSIAPDPDPHEQFRHLSCQLFATQKRRGCDWRPLE